MVVCKFFQQGNCRYGQSCRFEHVYSSKYSYHASSPQSPQSSTTGVTDEQLLNQVQSDIQAALHGGQWLLSRYTPFKEKAEMPGLQDLSFEEARLFIYEARAANNAEQVVAYMNQLFHEAKTKHEQLAQPNANILKTLRSLYRGEPVTSPFQSAFGSNTAATSVFRNAVQTSVFGQASTAGFAQNTSVFGQSNDAAKSIFAQAAQSQNVFGTNQNAFSSNQSSPSVFGTNAANQTNQNVFASSGTDPAKSIFAQAANQSNQNVFATSGNVPAKSIFAQANQTFANQPQNPASLFATANQSQPTFGQSPFQSSNVQNTSVFQTSQPKNVFEQSVVDDDSYTNLEDLSQDDFDAFQSDSFQLGFVPEMPPPRALCI